MEEIKKVGRKPRKLTAKGITVYIDTELIERIDELTYNRSAFINEAIKEKLSNDAKKANE